MPESAQSTTIDAFNSLEIESARDALIACCTSPRWVDSMLAGRPYESVDSLLGAADRALAELEPGDIMAALAGHPRIGEPAAGPGAESSQREQAGMDAASDETREALVEGNRAYEERFGHIYVVSALDRSADELLAMLRRRLRNNVATETRETAAQLRLINRLRLTRMLESILD